MATDTEQLQTPARKPARVLVAEDSPLNLQVALMQLEKLGYAADAATDGKEVIAALDRATYDIILMDCQMPEMSGYEATWQIRDREKQQSETSGNPTHVYIIAMTANTEADNREKCQQAGMDGFITKPVQLPELEAALHRALADRVAQQAIEAVIDPVVIASLRQLNRPGKPDRLASLIDLFVQEAPGQLDAMQSAITKNDLTTLSRTLAAASALKGSAGNLGARGLAAVCDEIEQVAQTGVMTEVTPLVQKAREEFDRVREALDHIKSESAASE